MLLHYVFVCVMLITIGNHMTDATPRPVTEVERDVWLGLRQGLIMQLSAEERSYRDRKAALRQQIARIESYLGLHQS